MSKFQLMLTSLIAVVPGAVLIYVLVMAMLFTEGLPTMAYAVMGGTLLAATATVLIPAGVMVGGKKSATAKVDKKKNNKNEPEASMDSVEEELAVTGDAVVEDVENYDSMSDDNLEVGASQFELDNTFDSMAEVEVDADTEPVEDFELTEAGSDDFEVGEIDVGEEDDMQFNFDEIEEEEPKPKKKKK